MRPAVASCSRGTRFDHIDRQIEPIDLIQDRQVPSGVLDVPPSPLYPRTMDFVMVSSPPPVKKTNSQLMDQRWIRMKLKITCLFFVNKLSTPPTKPLRMLLLRPSTRTCPLIHNRNLQRPPAPRFPPESPPPASPGLSADRKYLPRQAIHHIRFTTRVPICSPHPIIPSPSCMNHPPHPYPEITADADLIRPQ